MVECTPYRLRALQFINLEWLPEDVLTREAVKTTERVVVGKKMMKSKLRFSNGDVVIVGSARNSCIEEFNFARPRPGSCDHRLNACS
jgi:hypothetical protein